jgi:type II secretory ATPase GspE/PulE/Tfp pilus assembly ATPase PilB-like protein
MPLPPADAARLNELRKKEEEELAQMLSKKYGIGYMDLTRISINADALRILPEADAREAEVAPFDKVGKRISLAVRAPEGDKIGPVREALTRAGYEVVEFMVSQASLARAWERYKDISHATESKEGILDISPEALANAVKNIKSIDDVKLGVAEVMEMKRASRISKIAEVVLAGAFAVDASDVHIEPEADGVRLRYRLDGVLNDVARFDQDTFRLLLSRIKLLSGLKLNVHDRAQDGRFSVNVEKSEMEIRTSVIPEAYGESIVMRILDPESIGTPLEELGMEAALRVVVEQEIKKPNGMLLTTGPTGSGKTTALYACMKKVYTPGMKIITIEDPIEYHLPGVVQTQIGKDYTFVGALRSALRQDPDVIMVGEIRDEEVARTAIDAALTGHFVFSTLHTNNAAGAFPRLSDLGIDLKVVGSAMTVVLAQRLTRKLCTVCRKEVPYEGDLKTKLEAVVARARVVNPSVVPAEPHVYESVGCKACNGTGFKGRTGIFEGIVVDGEIDKLVRNNVSERDIQEIQKKRPLLFMSEHGAVKVLQGITSLDELERVVLLTAI